MWGPIIAQILAVLLPIFLEWLESLFKKTEPKLTRDPSSFATPEEGVDYLFGEMRKERIGFIGRIKLRFAHRLARRNAAAVMSGCPFSLTPEEVDEMNDFELAA